MRNSPGAIAHLLTKMNITHLLVGPEAPYQDLTVAAFRIMKQEGENIPSTSTMLAFEDIVRDEGGAFEPLPDMHVTWDDPSIVLHSSGAFSWLIPSEFNTNRYGCRYHRIPKANRLVALAIPPVGHRPVLVFFFHVRFYVTHSE